MPLARSIMILISQTLIIMTFNFMYLSSHYLNSGIFASLFTSSIIYTTLLFYFFYRQKISITVFIGMICIITCVIMIGVGKQTALSNIEEVDQNYFNLAILCGLLTGLEFSCGLLLMKALLTSYKFPAMQINFDSSLAQAVLLAPLFFYEIWSLGYCKYSIWEIFLYCLAYYLKDIACVFITLGIKYGKGGIVDAIKNLSVLWQTLIIIIVSHGV